MFFCYIKSQYEKSTDLINGRRKGELHPLNDLKLWLNKCYKKVVDIHYTLWYNRKCKSRSYFSIANKLNIRNTNSYINLLVCFLYLKRKKNWKKILPLSYMDLTKHHKSTEFPMFSPSKSGSGGVENLLPSYSHLTLALKPL